MVSDCVPTSCVIGLDDAGPADPLPAQRKTYEPAGHARTGEHRQQGQQRWGGCVISCGRVRTLLGPAWFGGHETARAHAPPAPELKSESQPLPFTAAEPAGHAGVLLLVTSTWSSASAVAGGAGGGGLPEEGGLPRAGASATSTASRPVTTAVVTVVDVGAIECPAESTHHSSVFSRRSLGGTEFVRSRAACHECVCHLQPLPKIGNVNLCFV